MPSEASGSVLRRFVIDLLDLSRECVFDSFLARIACISVRFSLRDA